jgi:hypothetical protein
MSEIHVCHKHGQYDPDPLGFCPTCVKEENGSIQIPEKVEDGESHNEYVNGKCVVCNGKKGVRIYKTKFEKKGMPCFVLWCDDCKSWKIAKRMKRNSIICFSLGGRMLLYLIFNWWING